MSKVAVPSSFSVTPAPAGFATGRRMSPSAFPGCAYGSCVLEGSTSDMGRTSLHAAAQVSPAGKADRPTFREEVLPDRRMVEIVVNITAIGVLRQYVAALGGAHAAHGRPGGAAYRGAQRSADARDDRAGDGADDRHERADARALRLLGLTRVHEVRYLLLHALHLLLGRGVEAGVCLRALEDVGRCARHEVDAAEIVGRHLAVEVEDLAALGLAQDHAERAELLHAREVARDQRGERREPGRGDVRHAVALVAGEACEQRALQQAHDVEVAAR